MLEVILILAGESASLALAECACDSLQLGLGSVVILAVGIDLGWNLEPIRCTHQSIVLVMEAKDCLLELRVVSLTQNLTNLLIIVTHHQDPARIYRE